MRKIALSLRLYKQIKTNADRLNRTVEAHVAAQLGEPVQVIINGFIPNDGKRVCYKTLHYGRISRGRKTG